MKQITHLLFIMIFISSYSQNDTYVQGKEFNSVFQDLKSGNFLGTINGLLIVQKNNQEILLDFQGTTANLDIEYDENEMYDVSYKYYKGITTSGKTRIVYENYASANGLKVYMNNTRYELSGLDGASDMVINGIDYEYKLEKEWEYLILHFTKKVTLTNYRFLLETNGYPKDKDALKKLEISTEKIYILPNSTLVFAIKR
jgi:hypothetical protein